MARMASARVDSDTTAAVAAMRASVFDFRCRRIFLDHSSAVGPVRMR
jgi:hypothetical protein